MLTFRCQRVSKSQCHNKLPTMRFLLPLMITMFLGNYAAAQRKTYSYISSVWIVNEEASFDICNGNEFALLHPVMENDLEEAYTSVLPEETQLNVQWDSYNSLDRGSLALFGDRRLQESTTTNEEEERDLCGCPCICASSQWLCDAYCGGGRRRLRALTKISRGKRAQLEDRLKQNCQDRLSTLTVPGASATCLTALQGATCHAEVVAD